MRKPTVFLVSAAMFVLAVADEDENVARLLGKSAQHLMDIPMPPGGHSAPPSGGYTNYEVQQPTHYDLAISRLQTKTKNAVRDVWESLRDPQKFAILETKPGGAAKQILKVFASELQGDIFAVDQQNLEKGVVRILRDLTKRDPEVKWSEKWEVLQKVEINSEKLRSWSFFLISCIHFET